jgi:hypothetical protein
MSNPGSLSLILLVVGMVLILWKQKREYARTNQYGVQQYGSFWNKIRSEAFDNALTGLGYGSAATGALLFIFTDNTAVSWIVLLIFIGAVAAFKRERKDK